MSPVSKCIVLALAVASSPLGPAHAGTAFDGDWSVAATVDNGSCTGPYRYPIVIRDGAVDEASGSAADASGRVAKNGRIVGSIRRGLANIAVEGRLRTSAGTGRWTQTGPIACAGRWTAKRSG
ncbi:hypothetical protein [Methylobacterium goesingense]|uniref:Large exoprotein involved in heme utilization or adhesion n=1 Tax=Methylobacterium goesingense TaxID=243690 RepID=A0ABV2LAK9_9HYPH|nr:hypothetical protein [Methylobacterium goesingense]GJD75977.1 hypothetical protein CFIICLFH_4224 [Methylobacterium goesingense]